MKFSQKILCILTLVALWPFAAAAQQSQQYDWRAVAMGGGGFVDGIVFHPAENDLMYARTDVGGAYRWDDKNQEWIPLTDWLSPAQGNFTGIESLALDPADPNRLYLAAGTYSGGTAAILRSDDRGKTFQIFETPFRMGGNEDGRQNGERLAVDPNAGSILFFGSRRDGLWKSENRGAIWTRVNSFSSSGTVQSVGIVSVVFDAASGRRGTPTPVIYAAVSTTDTNFFRSDNAGATWQPVAGQPIGLRPNHLVQSAEGQFYLSYGSVAGPNGISNGAVWKFNPKNGAWTDLSPEKNSGQPINWGYGALAIDAQHPSTIVVTTMDRWQLHDEVFRSTNGGATWKGILQAGRLDYSTAPYTSRLTPHWTGTLAVNPNNPDQILFGTGYGIWCCTNATATDSGGRADWVFLDKGLEETVPLAIISPPSGAHLISGVADIDGFRSDDVDISPPQGTFAGTRFTGTQGLAFAAAKPELMVRIGSGGRDVSAHAASSRDGGKNWSELSSDAPGVNNERDARTYFARPPSIAMSADGSAIVWVVQRDSAYVTFDHGATWKNCTGFFGGSIVADPINPSRFYALDSQNGRLLASTNHAESFIATAATLPVAQENFRRYDGVLAVTTGNEGDIWAGSRNSGLYHSTDGGNSFAKLDNVGGVDALGFGKAAPEKSYPAIFLLGSINQRHARYYRSDDVGQTWVRIDDDQHQFANANVPLIIGDPRIYGRVYFTTGGRGVIYGDINNSVVFSKK